MVSSDFQVRSFYFSPFLPFETDPAALIRIKEKKTRGRLFLPGVLGEEALTSESHTVTAIKL